jgi:hypothetical protein
VQSLVRHIVMNILSSFLLCSMRGHEMSRQSISWRLWNQSALNAADVVSLRPCSARKASHFEWKHALKSSILVLNYIRSKIAIYERRSNIPPISQKTSGICSRVMKQLQVYLVLTLFHAFYGTMTGNSPSVAASMQSLVDVHDRNKSHDVTTPDPVGVKSPPEQRKVKTVSVDDRVLPRPSFGRKPVVAKCSPQPYRVRLRNGSCSRAVLTKMCYGECKSHTVPLKSTFSVRGVERKKRVEISCNCCSAVQVSTRRHTVTCSVGVKAHTVKVFHVPVVKSCTCRRCSVYWEVM